MLPSTQPESRPEDASQELPVPKLESSSAGSPTSSVDTKAIAKEVAEILRPDFERVAQSTKDKRIADIQKRLGISDLAELEGMGVQIPPEVKTEYRLRNLEQGPGTRQPERSDQTPTSQGSGATLTATDVSDVVKTYQLDANTPEVLEALRGTYRNRDHFEATMAKLALKRSAAPQPSAAESSTIQGQPPAQAGARDLENAYQKDLEKIMQSTRAGDDQRIRALANLKAEYRGKGLPK